jgi:hypothetical protein
MTEPTPDHPTEASTIHPSDGLMALIIALLAPMFLGVTAGDPNLARLAALETVTAYQARNHADLLAIAQIIAYGLAALGSLSLSMDDNISVSMALRLRGNANALNRSAEQNRRTLTNTAPNHRSIPRTKPRSWPTSKPQKPASPRPRPACTRRPRLRSSRQRPP